jgi:hypothetical protein
MGANRQVELLREDLLKIFERAGREVTIPRKDGRRQKYAAGHDKQRVEEAHAAGHLVEAVTTMLDRETKRFGHLRASGRPDLTVESLVADRDKPYHNLFSDAIIGTAQRRLAALNELHSQNDSTFKSSGLGYPNSLDQHLRATNPTGGGPPTGCQW